MPPPTRYTSGSLFTPQLPPGGVALSGDVGGGRHVALGHAGGAQPPASVVLAGVFQGDTPLSVSANFFIYRPFGAASPTFSNVPGAYTADLECGRGSFSGGNYLMWTEFVDFASTVDVRDGCTRSTGFDTISYADGDELRIGSTSGTRYVVVWVDNVQIGAVLYKRAYILRAQAVWPGPF